MSCVYQVKHDCVSPCNYVTMFILMVIVLVAKTNFESTIWVLGQSCGRLWNEYSYSSMTFFSFYNHLAFVDSNIQWHTADSFSHHCCDKVLNRIWIVSKYALGMHFEAHGLQNGHDCSICFRVTVQVHKPTQLVCIIHLLHWNWAFNM